MPLFYSRMNHLAVVFLVIFSVSVVRAQRDTLIYIGDPMCAWCYGFAPELDKVRDSFPNVPFEMVMGGLRAGGTEKMIEIRDYLKHHWLEVQRATGRRFNYAIFSKTEITYDTEPACRAVIIAGRMKPELKYEYFKAVQESFYIHNNLPNDKDTYINIAERMGIDPAAFHKKFDNKQMQMDAFSEFDLAASMGITSFPVLIAKINGKLYMAANGYQSADRVIALLKARGLK